MAHSVAVPAEAYWTPSCLLGRERAAPRSVVLPRSRDDPDAQASPVMAWRTALLARSPTDESGCFLQPAPQVLWLLTQPLRGSGRQVQARGCGCY